MSDQFPHTFSSVPDPDQSKVRGSISADTDTMAMAAQILLTDLPTEARRQHDSAEAIREAAPLLYAALSALAVGLELHVTLINEALQLVKDAIACAQPKGTV